MTNLGVAVNARTQGRLRIVGVDHGHVFQVEDGIGLAKRGSQARRADDVESGGEEMAGVEAIADRGGGEFAGEAPDVAQFFESAADAGSATRGVFE